MLNINRSTFDWLTPAPGQLNVARVGFCLGLAALTLGQALQDGHGTINARSISWLTASLMFLGYGLGTSRRTLPITFRKISIPVLIAGLLGQVYQLIITEPGIYLLPSSTSTFWIFQLGVVIAACLALLSLTPGHWMSAVWRKILVGLVLLMIWLLGLWVIKASPEPFIDTYVFQQTSAEALLQGQNPYLLTPPNIFGHMHFYGEELVKDGKMTIGNPYPPLSIYFSTLGYLAGGDIRYSHLLAFVLSGALIAFLQPGRLSKLAAYIFLFTPKAFFVVEQSWTEPIVVLFLTAAVFCAIHRPRWLPFMLGLLFASKQYFLFVIPLTLLFISPRSPWKSLVNFYGWMGGVMVAVTAPLAFWNLSAFLWNVGGAQWYQVFRTDALSYLALYNFVFDRIPSSLICFIALFLAFILVYYFSPRTPAGFVISIAWSLGIFFAFNKQAFCNYYFLVIGAICCALASLTAQPQVPQQEDLFSEN
jgi:hypothetical protein